ncbi:hypothetical protein HDU83_001613 [Entophlyctis luteolus]|nr:hypothetical protein HDU83_001613 [Entophlyctis luteolus]
MSAAFAAVGARAGGAGHAAQAHARTVASFVRSGAAIAAAPPAVRSLSPSLASAASLPAEPLLARAFKSKSALRLRCPHCFFAKRGGRLRVICKENPKHKQVQK